MHLIRPEWRRNLGLNPRLSLIASASAQYEDYSSASSDSSSNDPAELVPQLQNVSYEINVGNATFLLEDLEPYNVTIDINLPDTKSLKARLKTTLIITSMNKITLSLYRRPKDKNVSNFLIINLDRIFAYLSIYWGTEARFPVLRNFLHLFENVPPQHLFIICTAFIDAVWKPFESIEDFLFELLTLQEEDHLNYISDNWRQVGHAAYAKTLKT